MSLENKEKFTVDAFASPFSRATFLDCTRVKLKRAFRGRGTKSAALTAMQRLQARASDQPATMLVEVNTVGGEITPQAGAQVFSEWLREPAFSRGAAARAIRGARTAAGVPAHRSPGVREMPLADAPLLTQDRRRLEKQRGRRWGTERRQNAVDTETEHRCARSAACIPITVLGIVGAEHQYHKVRSEPDGPPELSSASVRRITRIARRRSAMPKVLDPEMLSTKQARQDGWIISSTGKVLGRSAAMPRLVRAVATR